jgi:hypothetical protein
MATLLNMRATCRRWRDVIDRWARADDHAGSGLSHFGVWMCVRSRESLGLMITSGVGGCASPRACSPGCCTCTAATTSLTPTRYPGASLRRSLERRCLTYIQSPLYHTGSRTWHIFRMAHTDCISKLCLAGPVGLCLACLSACCPLATLCRPAQVPSPQSHHKRYHPHGSKICSRGGRGRRRSKGRRSFWWCWKGS